MGHRDGARVGLMASKHSGALSELRACAWFLRQGCEVYRNVSQHGYADLVAVYPDGRTLLIDVKTRTNKTDGSVHTSDCRTDEQLSRGVRLLFVTEDQYLLGPSEEGKDRVSPISERRTKRVENSSDNQRNRLLDTQEITPET